MACQEAFHLRLVLLFQQRARRIHQPSARPHQALCRVQDGSLLRCQLGKVGLGQAQSSVRVAAPCSRAGAGRVNKNPVERLRAALGPFVAGHGQVPLHVVHPGTAQALDGAVKPGLAHVAGDHVAAVLHRGRDGQRLAAGAGAPVGHPQAWGGTHQVRDQLAAFVLYLHRPGLERGAGRHRAAVRHAQAPGRVGRGRGLDPLGQQRRAGVRQGGFQHVHPQVERCRFGHGRHLGRQVVAEAGLQVRQDPIGYFQAGSLVHAGVVQRAAFQRAQHRAFLGAERRRAELATGKALFQAGHGPTFQQQGGGHQQARRRRRPRARQPPAEPAAGTQHAPGAVGDGAAVAGADEPALAEKGVGDGVGWLAAGRTYLF